MSWCSPASPSLSVHARFVVFGLPMWALVDGTWASLSLLASARPEGYAISAYLILALTLGNLAPLLLGLLLRSRPSSFLHRVILGIETVGLTAGLLLSALWNESVYIGGKETSLPLFALFFVVGACSSSSNVAHFSFVSRFDAASTTAIATGAGLGSMLAGLLGIAQGLLLVRYGLSTSVYYAALAALYVPALWAFLSLRRESERERETETDTETLLEGAVLSEAERRENATAASAAAEKSEFAPEEKEPHDDMVFLRANAPILSLQLLNSSLGYGVVPAMVSSACGKFNNAPLVLLLATGITAVLDPWAKAATYSLRLESFSALRRASCALLALSVGLVLCASMPAESALYRGAGGVLPASLYVSFNALFGFTNTCVFRFYKERALRPDHAQHAYRWSGIASQSGAMLGSSLAFLLVVTSSL